MGYFYEKQNVKIINTQIGTGTGTKLANSGSIFQLPVRSELTAFSGTQQIFFQMYDEVLTNFYDLILNFQSVSQVVARFEKDG